MDAISLAYDHLTTHFLAWAENEPNIRAAIVIGSRARTDHPADPYSDLDLIIVAVDPQPYIDSPLWGANIAPYLLTFTEQAGGGGNANKERRFLFEGGLDVDFAMVPQAQVKQLVQYGVPPDLVDMFHRGVRILLDKDGLAARLQEKAVTAKWAPVQQLPSEAEFLECVNDFWYHSLWSAKNLRRGELWWAKSGVDGHLKGLLHQMIAWHARAFKGPDYDTWLRGRFLEEWADPRVVKGLHQAFAHYNTEDIWRALFATMDLFHWLSLEIAGNLGFGYPIEGADQAKELSRQLFEQK